MTSRPFVSMTFPGLMHQPSHVSTEINLIWAKENPDLFLKAVADFRDQTEGWGQKIDISRAGFITLHAARHPDYSEPGPITLDALKVASAKWLSKGDETTKFFRRVNLKAVLTGLGREKVMDLRAPEEIKRVAELIGLS